MRAMDTLYDIGQPAWDAHTWRAKNVKTPDNAVANHCNMALGGWQDEVQRICCSCFSDIAKIGRSRFMDITANPEAASSDLLRRVDLGIALMAERSWSSIASYGTPPVKYANVLHENEETRNASAATMQRDWASILELEREAHERIEAHEICDDCAYMLQNVVRVMFMLFERGRFSPSYAPFHNYMNELVRVLPDSRIVEQTHQHLREMEHDNKNMVTSRVARHNACTTSNVLNEREIPDVGVTEEEFKEGFASARGRLTQLNKIFQSSSHKLPAEWGDMMKPGRLTWRSPTPKSIRSDVSALLWALKFYGERLSQNGVQIKDAWHCRILVEQSVVRRKGDNSFFIILGVAKWCAIAMPLLEVHDGYYSTRSSQDIQPLFILGLEDFESVPCIPVAPSRQHEEGVQIDFAHGIVLKRIGTARSLVRHALFNKACCLDRDTAALIAQYNALAVSDQGSMSGGGHQTIKQYLSEPNPTSCVMFVWASAAQISYIHSLGDYTYI